MKGRMNGRSKEAELQSRRLCKELSDYEKAGVTVTVSGYKADIDKRLTDMLLRDGPCTYMRSYSFNKEGKVTGVEFERVKLSKEQN